MYRRCEKIKLTGFTDADWAGSIDDRRSTSGYCFSIGSAMVSWCSKKHAIVALSNTEAEYVAAAISAQECVWLKGLIRSMLGEFNYAVQLKCDNESAIKLVSDPIFHGRTKHIEIRYHYIRKTMLNHDIELVSVSTNDQVADIFTKALGKPKFEFHRNSLGVVDRKFALRRSIKNN